MLNPQWKCCLSFPAKTGSHHHASHAAEPFLQITPQKMVRMKKETLLPYIEKLFTYLLNLQFNFLTESQRGLHDIKECNQIVQEI